MNMAVLLGLATISCAWMAGCASGPLAAHTRADEQARPKSITMDQARDAVAVGLSTRSDLLSALGETATVRFESGYEVWLYRLLPDGRSLRGDQHTGPEKEVARFGEFVILVAPSGRVTKARVRLPSPSDHGLPYRR